jgi:hypothetical protein
MHIFQFAGTILATVFEEQSKKWEPLVLSHTDKAIALVHDYISRLLDELCPETQVRDRLWDTLLMDKLRDAYCRAMNHARFLLIVERGHRPMTFNNQFTENLRKKRSERMTESFKDMAITLHGYQERCVPVSQYAVNKDSGQQDLFTHRCSFHY